MPGQLILTPLNFEDKLRLHYYYYYRLDLTTVATTKVIQQWLRLHFRLH